MRPPARLHVADHVGDPRDARFDVALGGDAAGHEREAVAVALAELRDDADALDASRRRGSPARRSRSLRHTARPSSMTIAASIRWRSTSSHCPRAHPGAVIARRVEVVGGAAIDRGGLEHGIDSRRPCGTRTSAAPRAGPASPRLAALTRIWSREYSSLVRPMVNSRTSKLAPCLTTASKISVISRESIRWPSVSTISLTGLSLSLLKWWGLDWLKQGRQRRPCTALFIGLYRIPILTRSSA